MFDFIDEHVLCDLCSKDYTHSDAQGGVYAEGYSICPTCTPDFMGDAKKFKEEHLVDTNPPPQSFKDFVLTKRQQERERR